MVNLINGGDYRTTYKWSYTVLDNSIDKSSFETDYNTAISTTNSNNDKQLILKTKSALIGFKVKFEVLATNFVGQNNTKEFTVEKISKAIPKLVLRQSIIENHPVSKQLVLEGNAMKIENS